MIGETYEIINQFEFKEFSFYSNGPKGKILKYVVFFEIEPNIYNVGFGDYKNGAISDSTISNNLDLVKVMNTIGQIIYEFFRVHPDCTVQIEPVDGKRSKLYHTIFRRRYKEILLNFVFQAKQEDDEWEDFSLDKEYQLFRLTIK